jgi:ABC-type sugar transport system ATPase subunit
MVFQNYALYPHLTVLENIAFPLEARRPRPAKAEIARRVDQVATTLGIGNLLGRYPREISGGQQQRVALGRAMIRDPHVFLLDEPLSNLDARLRIRMRRDLKELHRQIKATIVYVTHDQSEAMTLSDRIAVFAEGKLQQVGSPATIYNAPVNAFVANFVGNRETNFLDGALAGSPDAWRFVGNGFDIPLGERPLSVGSGAGVVMGIRPEAVDIVAAAPGTIRATVQMIEHAGAELFVYLTLPSGDEISCSTDPRLASLVAGEIVNLRFDPAHIHVFDRATRISVAAPPPKQV